MKQPGPHLRRLLHLLHLLHLRYLLQVRKYQNEMANQLFLSAKYKGGSFLAITISPFGVEEFPKRRRS